MIYPSNIFEKLGFTEIKNRIGQKCLSEAGAEMVQKIGPQYKFEQIDKFLRQTHEFQTLLMHDAPLSVEPMYPLLPLADKAKVEGTFLSEEEFFELYLTLKTVFGILKYFKDRVEQYPVLQAMLAEVPMERELINLISRVLDDKGKIKDQASTLLASLTAEMARSEQEVRKRIAQIFKLAQNQGWTADGNLTVRDGRLCIPILAENKRKIKGFIHDESASGQTAYIEPEEVFHLNNKIRDLAFERRREIVRILIELTDEVRPFLDLLVEYHHLLKKIDFVRAKALFAIELEAEMPTLTNNTNLELVNAEHPLLKLAFKKDRQQVVPLNLKLDQTDRIIVVSGPNAGGKSVCMKTVGLLQLMVQSGLLIPADPSSKMGVFGSFFADIGDDQSIESDLSTYSAHLTKMKYFTEHTNERSLVLIDEFGTGTDPLFGGPIAEAVLEVLNKKKIKGLVTTHYSNLKAFAGNTDGLENASMLFDNEAMKPRYILQMGKPGSSYAFEIAEKIGLSPDILNVAKQKVGKHQKRVDTLLIDLEREKGELIDKRRELNKKEKQLERLKLENAELQEYLESNKRSILKKAKEEAQGILQQSNRLVEQTISEIKKQGADKEKTKALRKTVQSEIKKLDIKQRPVLASQAPDKAELAIGDWVKIIGTDNEAEVLEIAKNNIILALGELRTVQKRKNLQKLDRKETKKAARKISGFFSQAGDDFHGEIDVRGMRTDTALYEIEKQLDRAIMMGFPHMRIIHGKGDGILRKFIRNYLQKYSQITRIEDEHVDRGGDGITYAYLE